MYYFQYHLYKWEENLDKSIYFKNQVLTQTLGGNPVPVITITSLPVSRDSECIDLFSKYRRLYMSRTSTEGSKCSVSSVQRSKFEFAQIRSYQGWYSLKILNSQVSNLCRCTTGADRPVTMHFWRVGTNVYMVG